MPWKFWKPDKTEAQLEQERLQRDMGGTSTGRAATPPVAGTASAQPTRREPPGDLPGDLPAAPGGAFSMVADGVYEIRGRGIVLAGTIQDGTVRVGLPVDVINPGGVPMPARVVGIEAFRRILRSASTGENVGLLMDGLRPASVQKGAVVRG